jgi:tetratricopeptide (TPR) repeat protein
MLGNYKQELKEMRKGQKYYPNSLRFYIIEARALAALGKLDGVREVIEESLVIVPSERHIPGDVMLETAWELRAHGHMEAYQEIANQAVGWFKNRLQMRGVNEKMRHDLATALYTAEKWEEAESMFEELKQDYPENIQYQGRIGLLAARKGERTKALAIFEELESIERRYLFGEHTYMRARIASVLGEKERAVLLLQDAFVQGLVYGSYLRQEMDFEPLRSYKPFQELLKPKE